MALDSLSFKKIYKPTNNNLRTSSNTSRANQDNSLRINRSVGYENQRNGNVAGARENVGSSVVQKFRIQCYNCKEFGHVARECQKPKRAKDAAYHREKMLLNWKRIIYIYIYMAQLQEVSPDAADSGPIFDDEPLQKVSTNDHYNVFAMESVHPEQLKSDHDTYPIEQDAQHMIIDSLDMNYDREEIDQNDDDNDLAKERELLASLVEKLKCEIDESKNRNKFLETSYKALIEKLKELARRNSTEYASQMELECAKVRCDLLSYKMDYQKSCTKYTDTINALNQTISEIKDKLSAHQETISILSKQKESQMKLYKTQEDKELDKVIELENKVKVLDNIVYKTGQSVQTMNMLNNKCRTSFAKPAFLKKAQRANPRLYDIGCYNDNLALMLAPDTDEVIRLEKESRSKLIDLIRPFDYTKLNNLYDLFVPQREKSSEQRYFSERSRLSHINVNKGNSKEVFGLLLRMSPDTRRLLLVEIRNHNKGDFDLYTKSFKKAQLMASSSEVISEVAAMGDDVVIMVVSAIDGWTTQDGTLLDKIKRTKM
nr:tRNA modification GTPase [Tanacetum cinerariifolium]